MAIEWKSPREAAEQQGIKMLVPGPSGAGKTMLCTTTGEPTGMISAEAGLLSIRETKADIRVFTVRDIPSIESVLDHLVKTNDGKWVCSDSVSEIAEVVLANELEQSRDPRKAYGELATKMISFIKVFRDLPGYDLVMTAKQERVQDDTGKFVFSPSMPGKKLGMALPYLFDIVAPLRVERNAEGELERMLQLVRDDQFDAKDRSGKLDRFEEPNLAAIKAKILNGNTAKKKAA